MRRILVVSLNLRTSCCGYVQNLGDDSEVELWRREAYLALTQPRNECCVDDVRLSAGNLS